MNNYDQDKAQKCVYLITQCTAAAATVDIAFQIWALVPYIVLSRDYTQRARGVSVLRGVYS